tara:strand:- start:2019 stop:2276 length:258 start_codon:yes stop_codon:yes gene_type:complete
MDAVDFAIKSWENRYANNGHGEKDIELFEEVLINTFFKSIRENIGDGAMSNDAEIMLVLDCMNATMKGTDEEHAKLLSDYLGIRV